MALDGITIYSLTKELSQKLIGQRIGKIAQPEKEELLFTFKGLEGANRLLISANPSLPFLHMTKENKPGPMQAPNFCMLLRKHIGSGRITAVTQPHMERVICFTIEHTDELGDPAKKHLYVELMGKHSNIIFCDDKDCIIDSIRHVSSQMSSVREVLPGRAYFIPGQAGRFNPLEMTKDEFFSSVFSKPVKLQKAIYSSMTGVSPVIATELAYRAGLDGDFATASLGEADRERLYQSFDDMRRQLLIGNFSFSVYYDKTGKKPLDFAPLPLTIYESETVITCETISQALEQFFARQSKYTNMRQRSGDLRKLVSIHLERSQKKYQLQKKQLEDTDKKDKYRLYGEMLHTYGYQASPGARELSVINYYNNEPLVIPLDSTLSAMENAKKYFDRYTKLKRTQQALSSYIQETRQQILHLQSIEASLELAENEADLNGIKEELQTFGFMKKRRTDKKHRVEKSKPLHFKDPNGFHMYVGKNNYQNDELTFRFATGNDWWFHAKGIPGSHVIVKSEGKDLPDSTYEYAANLAAYYSSGRENSKIEIDYLQKKNVKKPNTAVPGFVIYYTNFSMMAIPDISRLTRIV